MSRQVVWITAGDRVNPSSRLRAYDVAAALRRQFGVISHFPPFHLAACPDALVLQKECGAPALQLARRVRAAGGRVLFDVCDPLWLQAAVNRERGWDVDAAMSLADEVIVPTPAMRRAVAAAYPAAECRVIADAVTITSPVPKAHVARVPFCVGWFGTFFNLPHLESVIPALEQLGARHPVRLRIIGPPPRGPLPGAGRVPVEFVPWTLETYEAALLGCDTVVLPMPLDAWNFTKSPNRLQLCLGLGLPAVISPVPAWVDLLRDCPELAFVATEPADWLAHLERLTDARLRARLGAAGARWIAAEHTMERRAGEWWMALLAPAEAAAR